MTNHDLLKEGFKQLIANLEQLAEEQHQFFPGKDIPSPVITAQPTREDALAESARRSGQITTDKKVLDNAETTPDKILTRVMEKIVLDNITDTLKKGLK